MNEQIELLFKTRLEGAEGVEKLAASVREVSGASSLASDGLASLEKSIQALTAQVIENTAALSGMEGGFQRVGTAATGAAGGVRSITNELRMMEGGMPIRAAAQFISQMEGLSKVMQMAFPVFGAIALVGVLDTVIEHVTKWANAHNPVLQAQQASLSLLEQTGKKYDELAAKARKYGQDAFGRQFGKDAQEKLESSDYRRAAKEEDQDQINRLERALSVLNHMSGHVGGLKENSLSESSAKELQTLPWLLGMKPGTKTGFEGLHGGSVVGPDEQRAASELSVLVGHDLDTARMQQRDDTKHADDMDARVGADEKKKREQEAKKRQQELAQAEKQAATYLREAMTFELTGLDKINEKYREKLELLGKTPKAIADINAAHALEVERETAREVEKGAGQLAKLGTWWGEHGTYDAASGGYSLPTDTPKKLQLTGYSEAQEKQDRKDVDAMIKVLRSGDDSDAEGVRRSLGITTKGNSLAVSGGRMSGQAGASADYSARVSAAREIFTIETQHLDLIAEQDKRDEAYATARKKRDEEVYRAAEQYENQLQTLREKDLQKYESMADSIFDAMHGHTLNQWFKGFALGQEKQVFQNAVTPILQNAGHMIGGLIPGQDGTMLGTLLHGTVFDSGNKGTSDASTTAKQTTRTADEIVKLRSDMRTLSGAPSADSGAPAVPDLFNLPMSGKDPASILFGNGGLLGTGSVPSIAGASALFNAGNGSGLAQFMSGLGGAGSNPLGAIFTGMSTNGGTVTQLTAAQQAGAAVATGAMLAGAGLTIASGISQGGIGGYTKAASAGLGAAAMLDPEPISKTILSSVAAVAGLVGSLFGTGPQQRSNDIFNELSKNQYLAPTALNVMQGMNGTYEDFDGRGNLRTSSMSAVPTVAEPYITSRVIDGQRNYYDVPGQVTSPYSGGATGTGQAPIAGGVIVNIEHMEAMDAASFHDFVRRPSNSHSVGEAMADHLQRHEGRFSSEIRRQTQDY